MNALSKLCCLLSFSLLTGCSVTVREIGHVEFISTEKLDWSSPTVVLQKHSPTGKKDLEQLESPTLDGAVNNTINKVVGGTFMRDVTIYQIEGNRYAVSGEVWGYTHAPVDTSLASYFNLGDKVTYPRSGLVRTAVIVQKESSTTCIVKELTDDSLWRIEYSKLHKIEHP